LTDLAAEPARQLDTNERTADRIRARLASPGN
jgi:hypothetical protein